MREDFKPTDADTEPSPRLKTNYSITSQTNSIVAQIWRFFQNFLKNADFAWFQNETHTWTLRCLPLAWKPVDPAAGQESDPGLLELGKGRPNEKRDMDPKPHTSTYFTGKDSKELNNQIVRIPEPTPDAIFFFTQKCKLNRLAKRSFGCKQPLSLQPGDQLDCSVSFAYPDSKLFGDVRVKTTAQVRFQYAYANQKGLTRQTMTPTDSRIAQIEKYRRMSGHERLLIGLRLQELSCKIARDGIKALKPEATSDEIAEALRQRLKLARQINERAVTG